MVVVFLVVAVDVVVVVFTLVVAVGAVGVAIRGGGCGGPVGFVVGVIVVS